MESKKKVLKLAPMQPSLEVEEPKDEEEPNFIAPGDSVVLKEGLMNKEEHMRYHKIIERSKK